jgi:hypothetical protein
MSTNRTPHNDQDRGRESAAALAALERRAAEFGIRPFDADERRGEQPAQAPKDVRREVDDFLGLLREWCDTPSRRSLD